MLFTVQLQLSAALYTRDPQRTELGQRIVARSIALIGELGFEKFTFKKLALDIGSTEASVYRYFQNKHRLLVYLISWYWSWIHYRIVVETNNLDPRERLRRVALLLAEPSRHGPALANVEKVALHRIVVTESTKVYRTKCVDEDTRCGLFAEYEELCGVIATLIQDVTPGFPYPRALASTVIEAAHSQKFFAGHIPSLTDIDDGSQDISSYLHMLLVQDFRAAC